MAVSRDVITVLLVAGIAATGFADSSQDLPVPYLGQTPPGSIPEVFAPGIVSGPYDERMLVFTDGGTRLLYQLRGVPVSVIVEMRATDGYWSSPQVASFSGRYFSEFGVTPDGRSIVLTSNRPLSGSGPPDEVFHCYRVVQSANGSWSEPEYLGENLDNIGHPSIAASGNLYFFRYHQPGIGQGRADLYMSMLGADGYGPPVDLGSAVNSKHYDVDPYVAPDESYLIFTSNREPAGLYATFSRPDGEWTDARYMGDELAAGESICPWVSPDGRYLFFTSNRTSAYGVPEQPLSYRDKLTALSGPGNGSNDIYWVDASIIDKLRQEVLFDEIRAGRAPVAQIFAPGVISSSGDETILTVVEGGGVNSAAMEHDPCVSPDESFLVFASDRRGGFGGNDLYVSFPISSGGLSEPINGPGHHDSSPSLTNDGTIYFFNRIARSLDELLQPYR